MFLRKNHLLRYWGCLFHLNWIVALTLSLLLKCLQENCLLCICINFSYVLVQNTFVLTAAPNCYLELLDKLDKIVRQRQIYRTFHHLLAASLEPLAYRQNIASFSCFHRYYFASFPYSRGSFTYYFHRLHSFLSPFLDFTRMSISINFYLAQLHSNSLSIECSFWSMILMVLSHLKGRHLLTVGSF